MVSEGSEEYVIGTGGRMILLCRSRNLAELCLAFMWKTEIIHNEPGYLTEEML